MKTFLRKTLIYAIMSVIALPATVFYDLRTAPLAQAANDTHINTVAASGITLADAVLNGRNGDTAASGRSFWASLATFDTSSPTIPAGVYSTVDLGPIGANTNFSASLTSVAGLPAVTPNTQYYFTAWSNVGGTWYPGDILSFVTLPVGSVYIDANINNIMDPGELTFASIQAAIDDPTSISNTIIVGAGVYSENVNVNKTLTIKGVGSPVVNAASSATSVFNVTANNVAISGLTASGATGGGQAGIFIGAGVIGSNINNNLLTGNFDGIWLGTGSSGNTLDSNTLSSNTAQGFELYHSDSNTLTNNHADSNTGYGFKMESADNNTLTNNTANSNSKYGFYLSAGSSNSDNNTLTGNTANSNTEYGIRINSSTGNNLTNNTFDSNSLAGLRLKDTITSLTINNNTITNSPIGIDIASGAGDVTSWTVSQNNISGNATYGVSNGGTGILNAENNWWGTADPNFAALVAGTVDFSPWWVTISGPSSAVPSAPVLGGPFGLINDATPTFSWSATGAPPITSYRLDVAGPSSFTYIGATAGFTQGSDLPAGAYTWSVYATNSMGNGPTTSTGAFTLDVTLPSAPSVPDLDAGSDSGTSNMDDYTSDTTPTFTGTAEANSTVKVYDGVTLVGSSTATGGGTYSVTTSALSSAVHSITATATDAASNVSPVSSALSVMIDTVAPTVGLSSGTPNPTNGSIFVVAQFNEIVTGFDATDVTVGNGVVNSFVAVDGDTYNININPDDGASIAVTIDVLAAKAVDAAGNANTASNQIVRTSDTLAPTTPVINTVATDDVINAAERTATVTVTGTNEVGSTVTLNSFATTVVSPTTWSYVLDAAAIDAFGQGAEILTAIATDTAGNLNATNGTRGISVDTVAPTVIVTMDDDALNIGDTSLVTFTFSETPVGFTTADVAIDNGLIGTIDTSNPLIQTATFTPTNGITDATNAITVGTGWTDAALNDGVGDASPNYAIDTLAPTTPVINIVATDDIINAAERTATVTVTGTNESGSTVTLNGQATTPVTGTSWSLLLDAATIDAFGQGVETLTAIATDTAGNPNTANGTRDIAVDTVVVPTVTEVSSTTLDNSYKAGDSIAITVTFSEVVNVTGVPRIQLETGDTDRYATYDSGSGTSTLAFNYIVQAGDMASDLDYITTNPFTLNGGTIKDIASNDAVLGLPAVGTFATAHAIVIDTRSVISGQQESAVGTTSVTITWTTDHESTSRVIYDTVSRPSIAGWVERSNYGYAFSTPEFDRVIKVKSHSMTIAGLIPGTTYYYRTVSVGSPEKVSDIQGSFTTAVVPVAPVVASTGTVETPVSTPIVSSARAASKSATVAPKEEAIATPPSDDQGVVKAATDSTPMADEAANWTPWIILLVLILLAGAVTGGYFYWFAGKEDLAAAAATTDAKKIKDQQKGNGAKVTVRDSSKKTPKKPNRW